MRQALVRRKGGTAVARTEALGARAHVGTVTGHTTMRAPARPLSKDRINRPDAGVPFAQEQVPSKMTMKGKAAAAAVYCTGPADVKCDFGMVPVPTTLLL